MLYVSYGITKSGSTLAFQLTRELLMRCGHDQSKLGSEIVIGRGRINFVEDWSALSAAVLEPVARESRIVVVKTHARPSGDVERLLHSGQARAQAIYRDPRDIALSLVDAGKRGRQLLESGRREKAAFSEIHTVEQALAHIDRHLETFDCWAAQPNVVPFKYDKVAFDTEKFLAEVAAQLSLSIQRSAFPDVALAATQRHTQFNKGILDRHKTEMAADQQQLVKSRYAWFYDRYLAGEGTPSRELPSTPALGERADAALAYRRRKTG